VVSSRLSPTTFAFVFLVTATCDGFSQVVGQMVGRRPLARELSPGKTVEGLLGGLVAAVVVALLVRGLLTDAAPLRTALLVVLIGLAGLAGDLAASWPKRRAGIKDYSAALPGQGGGSVPICVQNGFAVLSDEGGHGKRLIVLDQPAPEGDDRHDHPQEAYRVAAACRAGVGRAARSAQGAGESRA
jgi:hypothetical protein